MSLLWVTASRVEMVPLERLLDMRSQDFGCRVRDAWEHMDAEHRDYYPHEPSPDERVDAVRDSIAEHGITEPLRYRVHEGREHLADGNHRALAAEQLGLSHVPMIREDDQ